VALKSPRHDSHEYSTKWPAGITSVQEPFSKWNLVGVTLQWVQVVLSRHLSQSPSQDSQ